MLAAIRAERNHIMANISVNNSLNIRGKIVALDEYFPATACRIWIQVDKAGSDISKKRPFIPVHCFRKDIYKGLKQLEYVCVLGHLEAMKASFGNIAVADRIIPLEN